MIRTEAAQRDVPRSGRSPQFSGPAGQGVAPLQRDHPVDEHIVADTLAAIWNQNGFHAAAVYPDEDALEAVRQLSLDVAVCDIILGDVNDIEMATRIREIRSDCRIILISGAGESLELLEQVCSAGQDFKVLAKPFHPTTLIEKLRGVSGPASEAA